MSPHRYLPARMLAQQLVGVQSLFVFKAVRGTFALKPIGVFA
jgi:hypothetical protein